jgi:hypothetical protein
MFKYTGNNKNIELAVEEANQEWLMGDLIEQINNSEQFDMSEAENEYISAELEYFLDKNTIFINVYYPKWRWSKAIGYFSAATPTTINVNGYKLNRSTASFVGNFYHELTHMVSSADDYYSFDHGSNDPNGKENTAPYMIGSIVKSLFDDPRNQPSSSLATETYMPWYKIIFSTIKGWF